MAYVYLVASLIIAIFWAIFFIIRKDLRKKILFTSLIGGILGFTEIFFVPNYWNPQFEVFKIRNDLFFESFIFPFFLAGFSSTLYQVIFRKPLFKVEKIKRRILLLLPIIFFIYILIPEINVIFFSISSMLIVSFLFYLSEKKIGKAILINGILNFTFFTSLYLFFWNLFPSIQTSYNYEVLSGINITGIPFEELLFYFAMGTNFCLFYEILNKRSKNLKSQ